VNYCYKDFPTIIKSAGLNGFGANKVEISEITGKPKEYDRDGVELIDAPEYAPI